MKKIYPLILCIAVSCSPKLRYVGNTYAPSRHVDVYIDDKAIKNQYEVIGIATLDYTGTMLGKNYDEVVARKAVEMARQKGADAVLFHNYYLKPEGPATQRESKTVYTDSTVSSNTSISRTNPAQSTGRQILLLKYK